MKINTGLNNILNQKLSQIKTRVSEKETEQKINNSGQMKNSVSVNSLKDAMSLLKETQSLLLESVESTDVIFGNIDGSRVDKLLS